VIPWSQGVLQGLFLKMALQSAILTNFFELLQWFEPNSLCRAGRELSTSSQGMILRRQLRINLRTDTAAE
jgi:hypothetical protein